MILRRESLLDSSQDLRARLGLTGLTHIVGPAGSGKTLLAAVFAAETSRDSAVEWINTDGKTRFIPHLKATISLVGGCESNVSVVLVRNHIQAVESVLNLPDTIIDSTSLVIVDPINRVLDMSRKDPVMWGQELIEGVLPTLAALIEDKEVDIFIVSESRLIPDVGVRPVLTEVISRWTDHTVHVCKNEASQTSSVSIEDGTHYRHIAELSVLNSGACILKDASEATEISEVAEKCLARDY